MTSLHSIAFLTYTRALCLLLGTMTATAQGLLWTNCFGGSGYERIEWARDTLTLATNGDILIAGYTTSPMLFGSARRGPQDGFVARLRPDGAWVWRMTIGGNGPDGVRAILEEPNGDVLIGGFTNGPGPLAATPGAFQTVHGGSGTEGYGDAFVGRLTNALVGPPVVSWLTYLGGSNDESVTSISQAPSGLVVVAGWTRSPNFPTSGTPFQPSPAGDRDAFVAVFDPNASGPPQMPAATLFGGSMEDIAVGVAASGTDIVAVGYTRSAGLPFPVQAFDATFGGPVDTFIAMFDPGLSTLTYGSYLGGDGGEWPYDFARLSSGELLIVGETTSGNLPTANAMQTSLAGGPTWGNDGFVAVLDTTRNGGAQLVYGTYFGGGGDDLVFGIAVERSGLLTIVGAVGADPPAGGLPTTPGAYDRTFNGGSSSNGPWDAFVARLDPTQASGRQLIYSSFLGGATGADVASQAALTARGTIVIAGFTQSSDLPLCPSFAGAEDSYVAEFDLLPAPVVRYGARSPVCHGPLYLGVNSQPSAGNVRFEVHVNDAPAGRFGALLLGVPSPSPIPLPWLGIDAWVMPVPAPLAVFGTANGAGLARFALPLPPVFTWGSLGLQSVWLGSCTTLAASDALR